MNQFKTSDGLQEHYWSVIVPMARKYNADHGTDVKPWECVKLEGVENFSDHPLFSEPPHEYTFALAILEGKPVFVGDKVYSKLNYGAVIDWNYLLPDDWNCWTWAPPNPKRRSIYDPMRRAEGLIEQMPDTHEGASNWLMYHGDGEKAESIRKKFDFKKPDQKRTFMLNGVGLPCPLKSEPSPDNLNYATLCNNGQEFYFENCEDKQVWRKAFSEFLTEARDN